MNTNFYFLISSDPLNISFEYNTFIYSLSNWINNIFSNIFKFQNWTNNYSFDTTKSYLNFIANKSFVHFIEIDEQFFQSKFFFKLLTHVVDDWRHPEGNPDQEQRHGEKEASCGHDRPTRPWWKFFRIDELFLRTGIVNLASFPLPLSAWPVILLPRCLDLLSTAQDLLFFQLIRYVQRHVIVVVVVDLSARYGIFCFLVIFVKRLVVILKWILKLAMNDVAIELYFKV